MKAVLGVVALFIGVALVLCGVYGIWAAVALSGSEPEFAGVPGVLGFMALLLGSFLCWMGWSLSKSADRSG